jgi:hypothetical protein
MIIFSKKISTFLYGTNNNKINFQTIDVRDNINQFLYFYNDIGNEIKRL